MADPVPGAEKAAGGVGGFLTKKIGPLPLWAYAAAAGVGLLALKFVHGGTSSGGGGGVSLASPVPVASGGAPAGSGGDLVPPAPTGPRQAPPPQDVPVPTEPLPPDNLPRGVLRGPDLGPVVIPGEWWRNGLLGGGSYSPPSTVIPGTPTLTPTAPVQPPAGEVTKGTFTGSGWSGGSMPSYSSRPSAGPMSEPSGPTVSPGNVYGGIDNSPANVAARYANINPLVNRWTPESLDPNHPLATAATQGTMGTDIGASAK